tara:strand:+ start:1834 stop:2055 length:222 start_codon:yes stop_codon:yes gene_type:complete
MTILNARYLMDPSTDSNAHIEIVYADRVVYVDAETQEEGWDDLQSWISDGNTVVAYAEDSPSTPTWVSQVRSA